MVKPVYQQQRALPLGQARCAPDRVCACTCLPGRLLPISPSHDAGPRDPPSGALGSASLGAAAAPTDPLRAFGVLPGARAPASLAGALARAPRAQWARAVGPGAPSASSRREKMHAGEMLTGEDAHAALLLVVSGDEGGGSSSEEEGVRARRAAAVPRRWLGGGRFSWPCRLAERARPPVRGVTRGCEAAQASQSIRSTASSEGGESLLAEVGGAAQRTRSRTAAGLPKRSHLRR